MSSFSICNRPHIGYARAPFPHHANRVIPKPCSVHSTAASHGIHAGSYHSNGPSHHEVNHMSAPIPCLHSKPASHPAQAVQPSGPPPSTASLPGVSDLLFSLHCGRCYAGGGRTSREGGAKVHKHELPSKGEEGQDWETSVKTSKHENLNLD
eukprot:1028522-Pelagomonas_calceolata.AAC.3